MTKKLIYLSATLMLMTGVVTAQSKTSSQAVLTNSSSPDGLSALKKAKEEVMAQFISLNETYTKIQRELSAAIKEGKDEATLTALKAKQESLKKDMEPFRTKISQTEKQILEQYPSSIEAADILIYSIGRMPLKEGLPKYEILSVEAKNSRSGKMLKEQLDGLKAGSPGAKATNFTSTELRGEKLSLSDYRGKYVLIDFWASWCVPCRKGNPHLLDLYDKYKDKGFEIIGVASDDGHEDKWKEAIDKDKIGVWKHILRGYKGQQPDPKDKRLDISNAYGIATLPTKILIDPKGNVIGRYGGGGENEEAMDKKLAEEFGR